MGKHYGQLDLDERIELSRHHDAGTAPSEIARIMGRHTSTIGRELSARKRSRVALNKAAGRKTKATLSEPPPAAKRRSGPGRAKALPSGGTIQD